MRSARVNRGAPCFVEPKRNPGHDQNVSGFFSVAWLRRLLGAGRGRDVLRAEPNMPPRGQPMSQAPPSDPPTDDVLVTVDPPPGSTIANSPTGPLLQALSAHDMATALTLYRADHDRMAAILPPQALFTLGTLAAKEREIPMAIAALKKVAYANDPIAARALFLLARLYTDVRNDYDAAETHLRTLLRKFPQSPEAQGAEQMLKRLGYGAEPPQNGKP